MTAFSRPATNAEMMYLTPSSDSKLDVFYSGADLVESEI